MACKWLANPPLHFLPSYHSNEDGSCSTKVYKTEYQSLDTCVTQYFLSGLTMSKMILSGKFHIWWLRRELEWQIVTSGLPVIDVRVSGCHCQCGFYLVCYRLCVSVCVCVCVTVYKWMLQILYQWEWFCVFVWVCHCILLQLILSCVTYAQTVLRTCHEWCQCYSFLLFCPNES